MRLLKSVRIRNFKAIRDSGVLKLRPFTVLIGNNGSGKSSLLEALENYQAIIRDGVHTAMLPWKGFEHIRNFGAEGKKWRTKEGREYVGNPMRFYVRMQLEKQSIRLCMRVVSDGNRLYIASEEHSQKNFVVTRNSEGFVATPMVAIRGAMKSLVALSDGVSMISPTPSVHDVTRFDPTPIAREILNWQFMLLEPEQMGEPCPQQRTGGKVRLQKDGRNVADYLRSINDSGEDGQRAISDLIDAMHFVLPYVQDIKTQITSELERAVYLQANEQGLKKPIPGWLLSTGTLRVVALLALLKDPTGPSVIFIEEIENGLDPRTVGLLVDEIRRVTQSGEKQVIATTHSPYLLDLLELDDVLLCERGEKGPEFTWPADRVEMEHWRSRFLPGRLYTMNALQREEKPISTQAAGEMPKGGWGEDE